MENNRPESIAASLSTEIAGTKRETIIAVDDDRDILAAIDIILSGEGFRTVMLTDGRSIMRNEEILPDLYILDCLSPHATGLQICLWLKSQVLTAKIPIIMISCNANEKAIAIEAGAFAFVEKPFHLQNFVGIIAAALASRV